MHKEELIRKHELVSSQQYQEIRLRQLNNIVEKASSPISAEVLRGMLLLINETDQWEAEYNAALKKKE